MPKAEETKAWIIEKTAPVFNQKGFTGTTLTDMTEATGLTKGSIYNNFLNKDEVALAVFDYNLKQVNAIINAELGKYTSAKEQLLAYARIYSNSHKHPFPVGGCPVLNTAVEADDTHPQLRKKTGAAIEDWKNKLMRLVSKGIKNKEFRASAHPEETAIAMIAMIEGAIMMTRATGKSSYIKTAVRSVERMIEELT